MKEGDFEKGVVSMRRKLDELTTVAAEAVCAEFGTSRGGVLSLMEKIHADIAKARDRESMIDAVSSMLALVGLYYTTLQMHECNEAEADTRKPRGGE